MISEDKLINMLPSYEKDVIKQLESLIGESVPFKETLRVNETGAIISFFNKDFIVKLVVSGKGLKELPENFGNLRKLMELNLSNNELSSIPDSIGNMKSLRFLDLSKKSPRYPLAFLSFKAILKSLRC